MRRPQYQHQEVGLADSIARGQLTDFCTVSIICANIASMPAEGATAGGACGRGLGAMTGFEPMPWNVEDMFRFLWLLFAEGR